MYEKNDLVEINDNQYSIIEEIGNGSYGIVYKAKLINDKNSNNDACVAIKIPKKYNSDIFPQIKDKMKKEINFLNEIKEESEKNNIITLLDSDEKESIMVMPFYENTLKYYLRDSTSDDYKFKISKLLELIEQILQALLFIHNKDNVHRDIKITNILLKGENFENCIISDFGTVKKINNNSHQTSSFAGTILWGAPEQFIPKDYVNEAKYLITPKVDIYPVGLIIYALITTGGTLPTSHKKMSDDLTNIGINENLCNQFEQCGGLNDVDKKNLIKYTNELVKGEKIPFIDVFVKEFTNFVEKLLNKEIDKRLGAQEAIENIKVFKAPYNPIIENVQCPEELELCSEYSITISFKKSWIPEPYTWLEIKIGEQKVHINEEVINKNDNSYEITMPFFINIGKHDVVIHMVDSVDSNKKKIIKEITKTINAYHTAESLWKTKKYTEALIHKDKLESDWSKQILYEINESHKKLEKWLKILDDATKKISLFEKPEIYILCSKLLTINNYNSIFSLIDNCSIIAPFLVALFLIIIIGYNLFLIYT